MAQTAPAEPADRSSALAAAEAPDPGPGRAAPPDWRPVAVLLLLVAAGLAGVLWVFDFVDTQRQRELNVWQDRLALVAESRVAAVDDWLLDQRTEFTGLADNPSVQLLLTELRLVGGLPAAVTDAEGQLGYLGNLFAATAERTGYLAPARLPDVGANLPRRALAGIALLDAEGRSLLATSGFELGETSRPDGKGAALSIHLDPQSGPLLRIAVPVFALQGEATPGGAVGWVVAQRPAADPLRRLIRQPGLPSTGLETWLLRRRGAAVEYLLEAGGAEGGGQLAADTPDLDAAVALAEPGAFGLRVNRRGDAVVATARSLAQLPLTLMISAERAVVLSESEARLRRLMTLLLLAIGLTGAAMAVVWRHGASRRARAAANAHRQAARELAEQRDLLRLVTDHQPTAITILDAEGRYRFANRRAAERAGIAGEDMLGKKLAAVHGPAAARRALSLAEQARERGEAVGDLLRIEPSEGEGDGGRGVFATDYIPVPATAALEGAVLAVERDLTVEYRERARRERALNDLVEALVRLVDERDPYAADHSQRVGRLAESLAREMGLAKRDCETARIAGLLMNVGKIAVPEDLLTRRGELSEEERRLIRDSMGASADLLQGVEFDGPVAETLRQAQARPGAGATLPTARILAVANAFVGMVSDRAWRRRLTVDAAIAELLSEIGGRYDRGVVAALVSQLDNRGGRAAWEEPGQDPAPG